MIAALIFVLHAALAVVMYVRGGRTGRSDALLGAGTVLLIFAVGWTLSTLVVTLFWPERGIGVLIDDWNDTPTKQFLYREITQDTASLVLLTLGEVPLYWKMMRGWKSGREEGAGSAEEGEGA